MSGAGVLVDNDVVFKLCAYGRHRVLARGPRWGPARMLPFAKFVLRDLVRGSRRVRDRPAVALAIEEAATTLATVDPGAVAIALAAEIEEEAAARGLELDSGESQLVAVLVLEGGGTLLTGDKRAVAAVEALARPGTRRSIASLEHVLVDLLAAEGDGSLAEAVCREPEVDRATSVCFGCGGGSPVGANSAEGLDSYLRHLLARAPNCLMLWDATPDPEREQLSRGS